ncbi:helix-turn-helix transcriptional regulator [Actinomadura sp. K4S16]|uniref:helix-turn-helix domain-containing protein n=1 Tax=Actinomadura sp. K4S16 TaxID=1316147 RepID=UPI001358BBC1|nr:helix-turn-helix transcriptional regulator [Actinomadura sp. K4S16]
MNTKTINLGPAHDEFVRELRDQRLRGGQLPLRDLERSSAVSKSTISRLLAGTTLPRWRFVRPVLRAMDVAEPELDTLWKQRWMAAFAEHEDLPPTTLSTTTPLRVVDGEQSATPRVDPQRHQA